MERSAGSLTRGWPPWHGGDVPIPELVARQVRSHPFAPTLSLSKGRRASSLLQSIGTTIAPARSFIRSTAA